MWPENSAAVALFQRMRSQWRMGFKGPVGLDYCAMYPLMDRMQLGHDEWLELLDDIRAMEQAALNQMAENASET